ncbi:MAG: hypothetical protein KatS3mg129_2625 [Leptospiraceae bacterium]|nr:MAG: hypothetical protein KatS3mg129_2625 [Leptospiraceae bacterium]
MKVEELQNYLKDIQTTYQRFEVIESLAKQIQNDKTILQSIKDILENCKTFEDLKRNSIICSYCIHILIQSQRPESMYILLQHIKSLPDFMPLKYVEFLGRLLPFFGKIIIGPAKELCQYPKGTPQHAIGVQILCNLFLDGLLGEENFPYLIELIRDFEQDPYFTKNLIDMVKSTREYKDFLKKSSKNINKDLELDEDIIFDDSILIKKSSDEV